MKPMFRSSFLRFSLIAAGLALVVGSLSLNAQDTDKRGRKYKAPPDTARIEVTILRDFNGKPIENAAVIFHPLEGQLDKGNMELKTNEDGKTIIDVLPIGDTVRMQVIAKGFQTYGGDYKIEKSEMAIGIRLKRPGEQYSIYKSHGQKADADKDAGAKDSNGSDGKGTAAPADKPAESDKNPPASSPSDKPADPDSTPPSPQPNATQPN